VLNRTSLSLLHRQLTPPAREVQEGWRGERVSAVDEDNGEAQGQQMISTIIANCETATSRCE
jgi:hypothetical protein